MSAIINFISGLLVIVMLLLATGCQIVNTMHTQDIGSSENSPSDSAQAQILRREPTLPHERLDEARAELSDKKVNVIESEEALRQEVTKPGTNAAVITYDRNQDAGAWTIGPWNGQTLQLNEGRVVIDMDINYQ